MKKIRQRISSIQQHTSFTQKMSLDRKVTTREIFLGSLNVIFAYVLKEMKQNQASTIITKQVSEDIKPLSSSKGGGR